MHQLPSFWHAAARLGARVDLSMLLDADLAPDAWASCSESALLAAGLPVNHASALVAGQPLPVSSPFLTLADPVYPALLRPLPMAPPVLFYRGNLDRLLPPAVAVVGARRCSGDGARMARNLAREIARAGGTVVSGLAYGIDAAAHSAAPQATIAVVGQGLNRPFTATQQRLLDEILDAGGLVLSEFLPDQPAERHHFPRRNRVIAGLSLATVVVEARSRSGALITARLAGAAGRDVFAVPGHPLNESAQGALRLLAEGATMVVEPADLLDAVPGLQPPPAAAEVPLPSDPILRLLFKENLDFDRILSVLDVDPVQLSRDLAAHQLAGRVTRLPGDRYALRGPPAAAG